MKDRCMTDGQEQPLLEAANLSVTYRVVQNGRRRSLTALHGISFSLYRGETLGIIGESGSGKTSLARALLRLIGISGGQIRFQGIDLLLQRGARLRRLRRHLQMIFQDPLASLDPRMQVADIVAEPLRNFEASLSAAGRHQRVQQALAAVGLDDAHLYRFPHTFSGGQAQRIAIARALIAQPDLIVCDEPLSALDVSIKSQIANLLKDLQQRMGLSLLFISHDLAAVRFLSHRVLVLYLGRTMEVAAAEALFRAPRHPYSRALMQAALVPDPAVARNRSQIAYPGEVPSPLAAPSGCVFRTRCPLVIERCRQEAPRLRSVGDSLVACHRAEDSDA
jgi:oligopeptide transport system ATP-binding protein